jgi:membrane protease YdiL (CAAX protease family)
MDAPLGNPVEGRRLSQPGARASLRAPLLVFVRRRALAVYFALACLISWLLWLPAIASEQGWWGRSVPEWWHYAGAAGPVGAAVAVSSMLHGRRGVSTLVGQYRPSGRRLRWLALALLSLGVTFAAGLVVARLDQGSWPAYSEIARAENLPALGLPLTFTVHLLTFGIGEETGWRGFALPHLQERRSALAATAVLLAGWATWHIPSFFENPAYAEMDPPTFAGWLIGLALGAVFLTWLYNSSAGSLLAVVLWHAAFNTITASEAASGAIAAAVTTGVMFLAVAALAVAGPSELRGFSRDGGRRVRWTELPRERG